MVKFCSPNFWALSPTLFEIMLSYMTRSGAFQVVLVVKTPPASAGDSGDKGLISGPGRPPGGGNGNPPHYACLENPTDRGT